MSNWHGVGFSKRTSWSRTWSAGTVLTRCLHPPCWESHACSLVQVLECKQERTTSSVSEHTTEKPWEFPVSYDVINNDASGYGYAPFIDLLHSYPDYISLGWVYEFALQYFVRMAASYLGPQRFEIIADREKFEKELVRVCD